MQSELAPNPNGDLWETLGVPAGASRSKIDEAYARRAGANPDDNLSYAWKALRDPYYNATYAAYGDSDVLSQAGFFDDRVEPDGLHADQLETRWLTTPTHKIIKNIEGQEANDETPASYAVLLTTGAFSPPHSGHLDMLESARQRLESNGVAVVGGYISPSHDSYVSTKYGGNAAKHIEDRLALCDMAVESSDWLMVDPWEGRYTDTAVNYTDVIERLSLYINAHVDTDKPLEVYYVFGGDNAGFARAFVGRGACVCVERPGYEDGVDGVRNDNLVADNRRIIFAPQRIKRPNISSSSVREGLQPPGTDITEGSADTSRPANDTDQLYVIRDESEWALSPWDTKLLPDAGAALKRFKQALKHTISDAFKEANQPASAASPDIRYYPYKKQLDYLFSVIGDQATINLDACTDGTHNVEISRLFNLSGGQLQSEKLINRPGSETIDRQLAEIPAGDYVLVDDDIFTGRTIALLKSLLPSAITINQELSLLHVSQAARGEADRPILDVVDLRDFILGARGSGLMVLLPNGQPARAPYAFPYVNLSDRANLPPAGTTQASKKIWELNRDFFKTAGPELNVGNADELVQNLLLYAGFSKTDSLADVCDWHLDKLSRLPFST